MSGAARRDISPFLKRVREFLLGRPHNVVAVRFEDGLADRTTPPPNIPAGPANKLSNNYYLSRDVRRDVAPPLNLTAQKQITSGESTNQTFKIPTPGRVWHWD